MKPSTKIFVDGDYRFPKEDNSTPGYIEVRNATFNVTARITTQGVESAKTSGGASSGGNRRSVTLKSGAPKPSSRSRPIATGSGSTNDVACQETPGSAPADNGEDMSFDLAVEVAQFNKGRTKGGLIPTLVDQKPQSARRSRVRRPKYRLEYYLPKHYCLST